MPIQLEERGQAIHPRSGPIHFAENSYYSPEVYRRRLLVSALFSTLLNLFFLWALLVSNKNGWLRPKPPPLRREFPKLVLIKKPLTPQTPHTLIETDPSQAVKEKPKNAEFYSADNTQAAQVKPSEVKSEDIPLADGKTTPIPSTETVIPNVKPSSPQPQPDKPAESNKPAPPPQPQTPPPASPSSKTIGDLALLHQTPAEKFPPTEKPTPSSPPTQPSPPQTTSGPMVPPTPREIPATASKLEGGVNRAGPLSFNSEETPYAKYDQKIVAKIGGYWHLLVAGKDFGERSGEVKVDFKLLENGRIDSLKIKESSIKGPLEVLCIRAINESAPFEPFPDSVKAFFGDHRDVTFYFYYY